MCGIAGFAAPRAAPGAEPVLGRMLDRLRHRGPDDAGVFAEGRVWLGHRRLSIVDLAGGHQPMSNENGSVWITYNGEIFNHADLRPALERAGHRYANRSDTETVVHAYEEYGPRCLETFRGMFAFALWDTAKQTLFCARDRLGIKPFYYYWDGQLFAFASEIKALLAHPAISTEFDDGVLPEYLGFGYAAGDRTFFRGIRKLMPGHFLTLDLSSPQPELAISRYWEIPASGEDRQNAGCRSEKDWIQETRRRLEETVRMRLMSDVPLGIFLSGGVDSAAIAALVKRMADGPVKTFSVGYREGQYSELGMAAETARVLGTEHHEITLGMEEFFDALPQLVWHEDEPIAWPSSVPLYFVSKLASAEVKVVLTGEGSDELFGGYARYRWNLLHQKYAGLYRALPAGLRGWIRGAIESSNLLPGALRRRLAHTAAGRDHSLESLFLDNFYCAFSASEQAALLRRGTGPVYEGYMSRWNSRPGAPLLARMLFADQKTYLVELLMKQDQMSMASSIESRVPFLDHHLVEFAATIPDSLKIRGGVQKYVLKKAVEGLLPPEIMERPKMGFPTPLREWFRDPRARGILEALQAPGGLIQEYVEPPELERILERHHSGLLDATDRLWRLLNLQIWGDVFLLGNAKRWSARAPVATV